MGKRIAGITMIRNGVSLDYCVKEAIISMQSVCDDVIVVLIRSNDGTESMIVDLQEKLKFIVLICESSQWDEVIGKEKLSVFQNVGISYAEKNGYDYVFLCQADECLHEDSIPYIKRAVELGEEGYMVSRINLWGDSQHQLNVPQSRKPVSTVVTRLAKSCYRSVDDGESISAPASLDFINKIEIFHAGFVRDKNKHVEKIKEIQGKIFNMDVDSRVINATEFDAWGMGFSQSDVLPIEKELPMFLKEWAESRDKINDVKFD